MHQRRSSLCTTEQFSIFTTMDTTNYYTQNIQKVIQSMGTLYGLIITCTNSSWVEIPLRKGKFTWKLDISRCANIQMNLLKHFNYKHHNLCLPNHTTMSVGGLIKATEPGNIISDRKCFWRQKSGTSDSSTQSWLWTTRICTKWVFCVGFGMK